ncbi:MAG: hypothetical protein EXR71_06920 [Myxococcales bacterium]|nr:hypothetical protein [Myxococcales bacterium]
MISLLLLGCRGCIDLPSESDADVSQPPQDPDTDSAEDTADTGDDDAGDGLPGRCALEEVEDENFNNDYTQIVTLPLETWACGRIDANGDREYYRFTTQQTGWLRVDTQAEARGSSADIDHIVTMPDADESVKQVGRFGNADPLNVFYADVAGEYLVVLGERTGGFGEEYGWWLRVSEVKPPRTSDLTELEPNDRAPQATPLVEGARYYGVLADPGDDDWYRMTIPSGSTHMACGTKAVEYGSAANMEMELFWAGTTGLVVWDEGIDARTGSEDVWFEYDLASLLARAEATIADDRTNDPDNWPEGSIDLGSFNMRVHDYDESVGSMFHWYTFECSFSNEDK